MSSMICPHCRSLATFSVMHKTGSWSTRRSAGQGYDAALRCNNTNECGLIIGGIVSADSSGGVLDWWPRHAGGKEFPDVPSTIAAAAGEAHQCLTIGAYRAAIATARAVVEATAKDKGITKGNLDAKIDQMAKDGVIGADTAQAAHAVRLWGNDAAHGDLALSPVDGEDAREVVALMEDVLSRAYQLPARTQRIIASREARRSPGEVP